MKQTKQSLSARLPIAIAITCIYTAMYFIMQQNIRSSADGLPTQYAENVRSKLEKGIPISVAVSGLENVDMQTSYMPFVMVYDNAGNVKISTAILGISIPKIPVGALEQATRHGENRLTWQPQPGVRNAVAIVPYSVNGTTGFVLAAQSLKLYEQRILTTGYMVLIGFIITLVAAMIASVIATRKTNRVTSIS
jgi:hypothetical protein